MLITISVINFVLLLSIIPLYGWTTICLTIHLMMVIL